MIDANRPADEVADVHDSLKWHALGNSYLSSSGLTLGRPLEPEQASGSATCATGSAPTACSRSSRPTERARRSRSGTRTGRRRVLRQRDAHRRRAGSLRAQRRRGHRHASRGAGTRRRAAARRSSWRWARSRCSEPETVDARRRADRVDARLRRQSARGRPPREPIGQELLRLGPLLERHERFPERTNVQLVRIDGLHEVTALVWERGAGETSASGLERRRRRRGRDRERLVREPGHRSHARRRPRASTLDEESRATLTGAAARICTGEIVE